MTLGGRNELGGLKVRYDSLIFRDILCGTVQCPTRVIVAHVVARIRISTEPVIMGVFSAFRDVQHHAAHVGAHCPIRENAVIIAE